MSLHYSQGNEFQFGPKNCNRASNTYEKWKGVQMFGAKIFNCFKTIKGSVKITSGCLTSSNLMDSCVCVCVCVCVSSYFISKTIIHSF